MAGAPRLWVRQSVICAWRLDPDLARVKLNVPEIVFTKSGTLLALVCGCPTLERIEWSSEH